MLRIHQHVRWFAVAVTMVLFSTATVSAQVAESWRTEYSGDDASGKHVIALWQFNEGHETEDASGNGHSLTLNGAEFVTGGRFGNALRSHRGWPAEDVRHAAVVKRHEQLTPPGPFTIEMWIRPAPELDGYPESILIDKKYVAHADYQWTIGRADSNGLRQMQVDLGFGDQSERYYSPERFELHPDQWYHVAFTYDAAGTVAFWINGQNYGTVTKPGGGAVHPGRHDLSIGDRIGSYYHGFPGLIDQVRITHGVREFRPITASLVGVRTAFLRMEESPTLKYQVTNLTKAPVTDISVEMSIVADDALPSVVAATNRRIPPGLDNQAALDLPAGESAEFSYPLDTGLRPGDYSLQVTINVPDEQTAWQNVERIPLRIVPRRIPHQMPVVMWGGPGRSRLDELTRIGFTHFLGLTVDNHKIWKAGEPTVAQADQHLLESRRLLNDALKRDLRVIANLQPGSWLSKNEETAKYLRVDRDGKVLTRKNVSPTFPDIEKFGFNVGASVMQTFGDSPALEAALINSELRSSYSDISHHPHEREAFRKHAGYDIPDLATSRWGVPHAKLASISKDRVIPDDDPVYTFYKWFWKRGDGWNDFNSAIHNGLHSTGRDDLWTFFDPAVRVPSLWGSGGDVDFISHWTYSYPDPIRIGLTTDELFAMARGKGGAQDVMKMTQVIWYRSQTAPLKKAEQDAVDRQDVSQDFDPGAQYITIAPMHLREAFWTKIARPIKGIMYHGWQSLVPTESTSAYRYTHPETQHELTRLVDEVVKPLGPTLMQIPAAKMDVGYLESFASQMFAGRGTYGWGHNWTGDAWHILQYAHLQPQVLYEETIASGGLDAYRVLVMPSCDVLPASIVEQVKQFQQRGGIIIADERLTPAIKADILIPIYARTKQATVDKGELLKRAAELRAQLDHRYQRFVDSSSPDVIPYRRRVATTDYIFTINDRREAGDYVGHHGLVMERGLPAESTITVNRSKGYVYDLIARRHVEPQATSPGDTIDIPVSLGPASGGVLMVTSVPIKQLILAKPEDVQRGKSTHIQIGITDGNNTFIDGVVPVKVDISDPTGRPAEFSGYYGATTGRLFIKLDIAPNDTIGTWHVRVQELASGIINHTSFRVTE